MADLEPGLYDQLIDELLRRRISEIATARLRADLRSVESAELPDRIGELLGRWTTAALAAIPADNRPDVALRLTRAVLAAINEVQPASLGPERQLSDPIQRLAAVEQLTPTDEPLPIRRPLTPLRDTVLMTNARGAARRRARDRSGDRLGRPDRCGPGLHPLDGHPPPAPPPPAPRRGRASRCASSPPPTPAAPSSGRSKRSSSSAPRSRSATTRRTTRLHAKAWMFHRATGFSTVYIGSSNLTHSAQVTGLEWNVRASERLNPELIAAFDRTFATYWADPALRALRRRRSSPRPPPRAHRRHHRSRPSTSSRYPFQRQILERLQVERHRGHPHNLVVAATGTGKTIIAALDYRHLRTQLDRARLLFVAHRKEILEQSRTTFRHVLRDGSFGELWVDGQRPERWEHVFASIQSLAANDVDCHRPGAVRRGHRRRVPPRRRRHLHRAARPPPPPAPPGADRHTRAHRRARRRCAGSAIASPSSCASGTPSNRDCSHRSTTSGSTTPPTSAT